MTMLRPRAAGLRELRATGGTVSFYVFWHPNGDTGETFDDGLLLEMGELGPEQIETVLGRARVQEVFPAGKKDKAAGLLVLEGVIRKGIHARLTREDVIVSRTTIASLRRFKDDVAEVRAGLECGVLLADTNDIKPGDHLEVFEVEERARTL